MPEEEAELRDELQEAEQRPGGRRVPDLRQADGVGELRPPQTRRPDTIASRTRWRRNVPNARSMIVTIAAASRAHRDRQQRAGTPLDLVLVRDDGQDPGRDHEQAEHEAQGVEHAEDLAGHDRRRRVRRSR